MTLYAAPAPPETEPTLRIGGRPLLPSGVAWPACAQCQAPMQFLAQVPRQHEGVPGLFLVFMCDNGGRCETWDAEAGANRALWVPAEGSAPRDPPAGSEGLILPAQGVRDGADGEDGDQLGNTDEPAWVQDEEYPACQCHAEDEDPQDRYMPFLIQLEESIGANFGDAGAGYGFHCSTCGDAKFLWQCC